MTLFFSPAQPLLLAYSPQNKIIFCKKTNSKKGTDQNLVCSIFTTFAQMPNHFFLVGLTFAPVRALTSGERQQETFTAVLLKRYRWENNNFLNTFASSFRTKNGSVCKRCAKLKNRM